MNKQSQIVTDTINRSTDISKKMRKEALKKMATQRKAFKPSSIVDDFIKEHKKVLTPAEKAKATKAKNKAQKLDKARLAREHAAMEKWQIEKKIQQKAFTEALTAGSRPSVV